MCTEEEDIGSMCDKITCSRRLWAENAHHALLHAVRAQPARSAVWRELLQAACQHASSVAPANSRASDVVTCPDENEGVVEIRKEKAESCYGATHTQHLQRQSQRERHLQEMPCSIFERKKSVTTKNATNTVSATSSPAVVAGIVLSVPLRRHYHHHGCDNHLLSRDHAHLGDDDVNCTSCVERQYMCVALGSGTRCVGVQDAPHQTNHINGDAEVLALTDGHAETMARRGFIAFLLDSVDHLTHTSSLPEHIAQPHTQFDSSSASRTLHVCIRRQTIYHPFIQPVCACARDGTGRGECALVGWDLHVDVRVHLVCTHWPCGPMAVAALRQPSGRILLRTPSAQLITYSMNAQICNDNTRRITASYTAKTNTTKEEMTGVNTLLMKKESVHTLFDKDQSEMPMGRQGAVARPTSITERGCVAESSQQCHELIAPHVCKTSTASSRKLSDNCVTGTDDANYGVVHCRGHLLAAHHSRIDTDTRFVHCTRVKPGRGLPNLNMSCSDKIWRWSLVPQSTHTDKDNTNSGCYKNRSALCANRHDDQGDGCCEVRKCAGTRSNYSSSDCCRCTCSCLRECAHYGGLQGHRRLCVFPNPISLSSVHIAIPSQTLNTVSHASSSLSSSEKATKIPADTVTTAEEATKLSVRAARSVLHARQIHCPATPTCGQQQQQPLKNEQQQRSRKRCQNMTLPDHFAVVAFPLAQLQLSVRNTCIPPSSSIHVITAASPSASGADAIDSSYSRSAWLVVSSESAVHDVPPGTLHASGSSIAGCKRSRNEHFSSVRSGVHLSWSTTASPTSNSLTLNTKAGYPRGCGARQVQRTWTACVANSPHSQGHNAHTDCNEKNLGTYDNTPYMDDVRFVHINNINIDDSNNSSNRNSKFSKQAGAHHKQTTDSNYAACAGDSDSGEAMSPAMGRRVCAWMATEGVRRTRDYPLSRPWMAARLCRCLYASWTRQTSNTTAAKNNYAAATTAVVSTTTAAHALCMSSGAHQMILGDMLRSGLTLIELLSSSLDWKRAFWHALSGSVCVKNNSVSTLLVSAFCARYCDIVQHGGAAMVVPSKSHSVLPSVKDVVDDDKTSCRDLLPRHKPLLWVEKRQQFCPH